MAELKAEWRRQLKELGHDGSNGDKAVRYAPVKEPARQNAKDCLDHAINHSFERASVMVDRRLLGTAYRYALGNRKTSLEDITSQFIADGRLIQIKQGSRKLCTTKEVLAEEKKMVELARQGLNRVAPMYAITPGLTLKDQQAAAVNHILTTANQVSIIRGAAGTGKTTLIREAVSLIKQAGRKVIVVAPTAPASRGALKEEGFDQADTVAKL